jgi:hypothetical protein
LLTQKHHPRPIQVHVATSSRRWSTTKPPLESEHMIETIFRQKCIVFSLDKPYHICIVTKGICSDGKGQHLCTLFSCGLSNSLINSAVLSFFFLCVLDKFKDRITQISIIFGNLRELSVKSPCLHPVVVFGPSFNPPIPSFQWNPESKEYITQV